MKKKVMAITLCFIVTIAFSACKKKETQPPVPQTPGPMAPGVMPPGNMPLGPAAPGQMPQGPGMQGPISPGGQEQFMGPGMAVPRGKSHVVIPDSVKGQWSEAKIIFEDKIAKKTQEYAVKLNSDFKIPNSNLKITVGEFLPDFRMEGLTLTSASNQPNNPALGIKVFENDKQIFPAPGKQWGWLFSKIPSIHPFNHPKYKIILKEGVKKG